MSYDPNIIRRAAARLADAKLQRQARQELRREELYAQEPRLREIDAQLRGTVARTIAAALNRGTDPTSAVERQRKLNLALQEERLSLLRQMGADPAELSDIPACPDCGDSGYHKGGMCRCLRALCAQEQVAELSKLLDLGNQSFEAFRLDYYPSLAGEGGRSPRQTMERVLQSCRDFAEDMDRARPGNLYLYGGTGLGKTFLSASIARRVADRGFSVVYDTAGNIFARFEAQKFSRDAGETQDAKDETRRYLNCDLLIVDDLGSEFTTPFVQSALYTLINSRLVAEKHTVISSNLTMAEVEKRYSPQVLSRLKGEYRSLPFVGEDIRMLKKNQ